MRQGIMAQTFAEALDTTQRNPLGTEKFDALTGRTYTYVKFGGTVAIGDAVVNDTTVITGHQVVSSTAAQQLVKGVSQLAAIVGQFGWIVTKGPVTCKVVVSTAAGSSLVPNATSGTLALAVASDLPGRPIAALVTGVAAGSAVELI